MTKSRFKGRLLFREVGIDRGKKLPKGKKLVLVVGVVLADDTMATEKTVDVTGTLGQVLDLQLSSSTTQFPTKYLAWSVEDIVHEYRWGVGAQPSSTRSAFFSTLADKALEIVGRGRDSEPKSVTGPLMDTLRRMIKTVPDADCIRMIINSIDSLLSGEDDKTKKAKAVNK